MKLEITHDEPVLLVPERRALIHGYGEEFDVSLLCYRLEEIVSEKLRALLQTQQRLVARGWNRPRARDYYDLWRLFGRFGEQLDRASLKGLMARKCAVRDVAYASIDDFFTSELIAEARRHWQTSLGPFVAALPDCELVLSDLRSVLAELDLV